MPKRTPGETVLQFQELMHQWEAVCAERDEACEGDDFEAAEVIAMAEYSQIFARYCAARATPRGFCYSEPPEYEIGAKIVGSTEGRGKCTEPLNVFYFPINVANFCSSSNRVSGEF